MRLTVLGRSPARPNPGEACAGYLVEHGATRLLVDVGPGVVAQLLSRHHPSELTAVVVSHLHSDHMLDLVTMRYSYPWRRLPRAERLPVYLPPNASDRMRELARGVGNTRHFEDAYQLQEYDDAGGPMRFGAVSLTPVRTQHYIPCWGFRAEADGSVLAYSADTAPCEGLLDLAEAADLLLCEATLRSMDEEAKPPEPRGHLFPAEAGDAARTAGARRLLLTHLPVDDGGAWARREATAAYGRTAEVAEPMRDYDI